MKLTILQGDVRETLKTLPADSVHCVVTSPPYWALRSYLPKGHPLKPLEIGSEPTPEAFIETMVAVFREVRRVLHPSGTCWVNIGDSYASGAAGEFRAGSGRADGIVDERGQRNRNGTPVPPGLKPKDLCLIPERLALALQSDGWWVRSRIAWCKRSPMPESVTDRPTSAWEHIWLLSKSARYYYDSFAVRTLDTEAVKQYIQADEGVDLFSTRNEAVEGQSGEPDQEPACGQAIQGEPEREGKAQSLLAIGCDEGGPHPVGEIARGGRETGGVAGTVQGERQAQGGVEAVLRERKGPRRNSKIPSYTEGKGVPSSVSSQASESVEGSDFRPDCGTVGGDTTAAEPSVSDVRNGETVDAGPHQTSGARRASHGKQHSGALPQLQRTQERQTSSGASLRNFWLLGPEPYSEAHFATYPTEIPKRAILAGTSARGCCPKCLAPWERVVEKEFTAKQRTSNGKRYDLGEAHGWKTAGYTNATTTGWRPTCRCRWFKLKPDVPQPVLDVIRSSITFGAWRTSFVNNAG